MQKGSSLCIRFFGISALLAVCFLFSGKPVLAAATDNVSGWLWSGTIGWISLNCTDMATCVAADYGVAIDATPGFGDRGDLSGWAWSETVGWICFGTTCSSPSIPAPQQVANTPEGTPPYAQYRKSFVTTDGVGGDPSTKTDEIYGWARVIGMGGAGWISLNCDKDNNVNDTCVTSTFHVVLNTAVGSSNFTKGAADDHYAWSGNNDGTGLGWVEFTAFANTSWAPAKVGTVLRPEGVFEPQNGGLAGTHQFTFNVGFEHFTAPQNDLLQCTVLLPDSSKRLVSQGIPTTVRDPPGLATLPYTIQNVDPVLENKLWYLTECRIVGEPTAAACPGGDTDCTVCSGGFCNVTGKVCTSNAQCVNTAICSAAFCRPIVDIWSGKKPIFTHDNTWSGLDSDTDDQYLAIQCNAGFRGKYFNNAARCDFEGDASFSLSMRRGVPIEGNCHDLIDNDNNGQTDCSDRYCQGISYRCQTLAPTRCVWGQTEAIPLIDCSDAAYVKGDLCCTRQSVDAATPGLQNIVNGLECTLGDANDGYFDCDCTNAGAFNASASDDCFSPGAQTGDLCCSAANDVLKL